MHDDGRDGGGEVGWGGGVGKGGRVKMSGVLKDGQNGTTFYCSRRN